MDTFSHSKQDVIIEAKRIILKEQIERITDIALSNVNLQPGDIKYNKNNSRKENCNEHVLNSLCKCRGLPNWNNDTFWNTIPNPNILDTNKVPKGFQEFTKQFELVQSIKLLPPLLKHSKSVSNNAIVDLSPNNKKFEQNKLLSKYFQKWKSFTKTKIEERESLKEAGERKEKLNKFIKELKKQKRLRKVKKTSELIQNTEEKSNSEKSNFVINDKPKGNESFKSRFLAQKNIIEKQKSELERQSKIIEDLKLNRIKKDVETSVQQTKLDLRETLRDCSPHVKCKIAVLNAQKHEAEESAVERNPEIKFSAAPKMVLKMEKRAQERAEKRNIILERKRMIDEERRKIAAEIVEKQRVLDEEERRKNLQAIKEKRQLEIEAEKIRQANKKRYLEKLKIACEFYDATLMKNGIRAFGNNLRIRDIRMIEASNLYETNLLLKNFTMWRNYVHKVVTRRNAIADRFSMNKLKTKVLLSWKSVLHDLKISRQVADDFYEMCLLRRSFRMWNINVCIIYNGYVKKKKIAVKHYESRLIIHTFFLWKTLPSVIKLEKVKEERKRKWREKVMEVLPDYNPVIDS